MLVAPALWNGYPLLQWDTGGYLARWYEGYLVPSRSTVFGLYLHFGENSHFWINLGVQALAALWILQLTLRVFGMARHSSHGRPAVVAIFATATRRRRLDDLALLAATVALALLGNAFVCGVISGPHDRYGARMAWVATFAVLISVVRHFTDDDAPQDDSLSL